MVRPLHHVIEFLRSHLTQIGLAIDLATQAPYQVSFAVILDAGVLLFMYFVGYQTALAQIRMFR
jgi:hypothetical protein